MRRNWLLLRALRYVLALLLSVSLLWPPAPAKAACAVEGSSSYQPFVSEVAFAFDQASTGALGSAYPSLPLLEWGPAGIPMRIPIPAVILKAVGYIESSWHQTRYPTARGATGPTLRSDGGSGCGYGIMQITSDMHRAGAMPSDVQQRVAEDYRYNIAWGAKMLADKWNAAPEYRPYIGNRDPNILENWYYAVWAYNGWLFKNNPNNPDYSWPRPPYNGTQSWTNYPYQELVWGLAAHPPTEEGKPLWEPTALSLPARESIGNEPGWIPTPNPAHRAVAPGLWVSPQSLRFLAGSGAPSAPQSLLLGSGGLLVWKAIPSVPWVQVYPPSGMNIMPTSVAVTVDASRLPPGLHRASLRIEAQGIPGSPQTVAIEVSVAALGKLYLPFIIRD